MLSIMTLAYLGKSSLHIGQSDSIQERRKEVVDAYVQRMLSRGGGDKSYTPEEDQELAGVVGTPNATRGQTEFRVDRLQPSWLLSGS